MRLRRRGFALILVLLATAGVFALALHSAVLMRAATVESRLMVERARLERGAHGAAVLAIQGLLTSPEADPALLAGAAGSGGDRPAPPEEQPPEDTLELPPFVKELLGDRLKEAEDERDRERGPQDPELRRLGEGGGLAGRLRRRDRVTPLSILGLPPAPIDVRPADDGPLFRVSLVDATGLLNINAAEEAQLAAYLAAHAVPIDQAAALVDQIIDWRDEDTLTRPRGAEQEVYSRLGIACRNGPFGAIEELRFLQIGRAHV